MFTCIYVPALGEGLEPAGTGVIDSSQLPCWRWEQNPGAVEEQPVLSTAKSSLQSFKFVLICSTRGETQPHAC